MLCDYKIKQFYLCFFLAIWSAGYWIKCSDFNQFNQPRISEGDICIDDVNICGSILCNGFHIYAEIYFDNF